MKIKTIIAKTILVGAVILLTGCSQDEPLGENETKISGSASDFEGDDYQEVLAELEEDGFTNIKTEKLEDLITGWLTKDGEVEQISIDGEADFEEGAVYSKDAAIVVTYHTFKSDDSASSTATDDNMESEDTEEQEILTIDNNEDLAKLLTLKDPGDKSVGEFASKYAGKTIKFDGNIAYMNNHEDYDTRYDILIYAGDYSETTAIGPNFQFNDVNVLDLNLTGSNVPDSIGAGQNLVITAKVVEFNEMSQLLLLKPVATEIR